MIDLGCGTHRDSRADAGMDFYPYPGATIVHNLLSFPWPIPDESYDGAISHQVLEHLPHLDGVAGQDLVFRFFDEVWRILRPGGTFVFDTPDYRSPEAHADVTHRRFFAERSFSHLWLPDRDPAYPRKIWELIEIRTDRAYGWGWANAWHVQKYAPRLDRFLCRLGVGVIHNVCGTLRKPAKKSP